ncbi:MAG TPA: hypothetical protein VFX70_10260 [Mycobacteriales bacterium]|nr:hypothetical protein [Mycobacteriales bacterium]
MTDVRQARQTIDQPSTEYRREPRGEPGWVIFAGVMLLLAGAFQFILGLTALLRESFFLVGTSSLMVHLGYTVWGWTHIGIAGALVLCGLAAVTGRTPVRLAGIVVALVAAVVNLAFLPAFPIWAVLNIALDVLALYSLSRWREFADRLPMGIGRGAAMAGGPSAPSHDGHDRPGVRGDGKTTTSTTTTTTHAPTQSATSGRESEEEENRRIAAERSSGRRQ